MRYFLLNHELCLTLHGLYLYIQLKICFGCFQVEALARIQEDAVRNGVTDTRILSREDLQALEPNLSSSALKGLVIPGEAVVDSWLLPITLAHEALMGGAKVRNSSLTAMIVVIYIQNYNLLLSEWRCFFIANSGNTFVRFGD